MTTTNMHQHSRNEVIDLYELMTGLWKQKWLIVGVTSVFSLLAIAYVLLVTPVYQATARVIPPSLSDVVPFNLGRAQAGLTELDEASAYALFLRSLTSQRTRRWFFEEHYVPYKRKQGSNANREALARQMAEVLIVRRPEERNNPSIYEITVNIDQPDLAAAWANMYVEQAAVRARTDLEARTTSEIANRRTELQQRIDVLRSSTLEQRRDRIARLKEALQIAEAVGFDSPQVTRGQTAAEGDLSQIIDGNLLYMRGSRAIRAELELLEGRENDDPFISELRGIEQQISFLNLVEPVPEAVALASVDSFAEVPDQPTKPRKAKTLVLVTLLGGVLGGLIALMRLSVRLSRNRKANLAVKS